MKKKLKFNIFFNKNGDNLEDLIITSIINKISLN